MRQVANDVDFPVLSVHSVKLDNKLQNPVDEDKSFLIINENVQDSLAVLYVLSEHTVASECHKAETCNAGTDNTVSPTVPANISLSRSDGYPEVHINAFIEDAPKGFNVCSHNVNHLSNKLDELIG